jgi:hypothetical protein
VRGEVDLDAEFSFVVKHRMHEVLVRLSDLLWLDLIVFVLLLVPLHFEVEELLDDFVELLVELMSYARGHEWLELVQQFWGLDDHSVNFDVSLH